MQTKTRDFLRTLLAQRVAGIGRELANAAPLAAGKSAEALLSELAEMHGYLADICAPEQPADNMASAALEELTKALPVLRSMQAETPKERTPERNTLKRLIAVVDQPAAPLKLHSYDEAVAAGMHPGNGNAA
jgi:hypothetical protein